MQIDLHITLGNQLFSPAYIKKVNPGMVYMKEDYQLCTYEKHHKHKLILFLSAMRSYRDELNKNNIQVHYEKLNNDKSTSYIDSLIIFIKDNNIETVSIFEIEDAWFHKEILRIQKYVKNLKILDTPMFLTNKEKFKKMCFSNSEKKQKLRNNPENQKLRTKPLYRMTDFYMKQRKRLDILMQKDGMPVGGKWTYDTENRKKIPKTIDVPCSINHKITKNTEDVMKLVDTYFPGHYGDTKSFNHPTTRKAAKNNLDDFISNKLANFGDFEDSVDQRSPFWFHSNLSSSLNIGLIVPSDIINNINDLDDIPINSYEGFIRQIIGWREFMRGLYHLEGHNMHGKNFFNHGNELKQSWYEGTTGLEPLDYSIKSTIKHSYSHHIERLMIQVNLMNLCEIKPENAYKWFMEMYIDSSDWVMTPNVYSMGLFADGGIMATKPYICGSNYIMKMMDFKKGAWCNIMDGLYWRFINKNREYFRSNARSSMMVTLFDKMNAARKKDILSKAEDFIQENTQKND